MKNNEVIRRLVSFDEDDTSTGFNSISGNLERRTPWPVDPEDGDGGTFGMYGWMYDWFESARSAIIPGSVERPSFDVRTDIFDIWLDDMWEEDGTAPLIGMRLTEGDDFDPIWLGASDEFTDENTIETIDDFVRICDGDLNNEVEKIYNGLSNREHPTELFRMYPDKEEYIRLWIVRPLKIARYLAGVLQDYTNHKRVSVDIEPKEFNELIRSLS